jgi:hypothetical protein
VVVVVVQLFMDQGVPVVMVRLMLLRFLRGHMAVVVVERVERTIIQALDG